MLFEHRLNGEERAGRSSPCAVCSTFTVRLASNVILKAPTSARSSPLQMLLADAYACVKSTGIYKVLQEKLDRTRSRARTGVHGPSRRSLITADHPAGNSP